MKIILEKQFWEEFLNQNNDIVVCCHTKIEAETFCKLMHEHGLKWKSGNSYLDINRWNNLCIDKKYSVNYTNHGCYGTCLDFEKRHDYMIYEFSDIIFKKNISFLTLAQRSL